jgi:O-antigen/teichoic acid export membrane protein
VSQHRSIFRNVLCNWTGFATGLVVTFALTPFVLHSLGEARYGIWTLTIAITGYYGLLDLGIRSGLTQYLTRYLAVRDFDRVNRTASSGFFFLLGCGALLAAASMILAASARHLFTIPAALDREVATCILIIGGSAAVQFAFFPFAAVLTAAERFDLANAIVILSRISTAIATVVALSLGYGLIGLSAVTALGNLLDNALRWYVAYRILPQLHISKKNASWGHCREFLGYGLWNALTALSTRLISYSDALVIGFFMPAAAIARFALSVNLTNYYGNMFVPVGHVFFPAATELDARGEYGALKDLYLRATRWMLLAAVSVGIAAAVWATDFYRLWLGGAILDNHEFHAPDLIFRILVIGAACAAGQRVGYQVLLGQRRVRTLAMLFVGEAVANLALSLLLVRRCGLVGIALGTTIPAVMSQAVVIPAVLTRSLAISARQYVAMLTRPAVVALAAGVILPQLERICRPGTWPALCLAGLLSALVMLPLVLWVGLTSSERDRYVSARIAGLRRTLRAKVASPRARMDPVDDSISREMSAAE